MSKFAGSGGHNRIVQGANSVYGKEHVEDRKFLDAVAKYVQVAGWEYVNCSDEVGTTQTAVWSNAANNHLRVKDSDVDLQFHLNASPGGTGCEVWLHPSYGNRELAAKISKAMADSFGLRDRGIKLTTDLGWINKTKTGLLPEICFIDNETDMQKYRDNFDKAAKAVAEAIVGKSIQNGGNNVNNEGYQYVKSGEFGTNYLNEAIQAMAERGTKGDVVVNPLTGLAYIQTEVLPNAELDKITWWMDTRPDGKWWYEYIKK